MSASYDKLMREIEKINAKLHACEAVLNILRNLERENANNPFMVEILNKLESVLLSFITSYTVARQIRIAKLKELENSKTK